MFASFTVNQIQYLTTKCPNLKGILVEDLQVLINKEERHDTRMYGDETWILFLCSHTILIF
jgi:hypothetical protein